jgi:hypothetical protein
MLRLSLLANHLSDVHSYKELAFCAFDCKTVALGKIWYTYKDIHMYITDANHGFAQNHV